MPAHRTGLKTTLLSDLVDRPAIAKHLEGYLVRIFAGCIAHAVNTGLSYFGLSAYFPSFEREFGWSRTAISGAFSLAKIEAGVLGPIEESDERYAAELLRSLEAFIERNGHWERAASDCYCHRHTLRYRIKRIEDLTGRDLSRANDRVEMWLALRAKELIA